MIERPAYDLTLFKVHFGLLTLKGYTKGERVLRFEAIVHNTKTLKTGRALEKFPEIVARLAGMAARFCTMLDCGRSPNSPGRRSSNSPGPGRVLILAGARGVSGDDAPGAFAGPVAGPVHDDLVAGVDDPVEQGFSDDGVGEQGVPVNRAPCCW